MYTLNGKLFITFPNISLQVAKLPKIKKCDRFVLQLQVPVVNNHMLDQCPQVNDE